MTAQVARTRALPWTARAGGWLRTARAGLFVLAILVGVGSGLGAVVFRYLIFFFTWLATGQARFGQGGYVGSAHLPWLGLGFFVVIPVIGGLVYGLLTFRYAREARGHGMPEVMAAVADAADAMRPFPVPLAVASGADHSCRMTLVTRVPSRRRWSRSPRPRRPPAAAAQ